jgi:hypothetical protein
LPRPYVYAPVEIPTQKGSTVWCVVIASNKNEDRLKRATDDALIAQYQKALGTKAATSWFKIVKD